MEIILLVKGHQVYCVHDKGWWTFRLHGVSPTRPTFYVIVSMLNIHYTFVAGRSISTRSHASTCLTTTRLTSFDTTEVWNGSVRCNIGIVSRPVFLIMGVMKASLQMIIINMHIYCFSILSANKSTPRHQLQLILVSSDLQ